MALFIGLLYAFLRGSTKTPLIAVLPFLLAPVFLVIDPIRTGKVLIPIALSFGAWLWAFVNVIPSLIGSYEHAEILVILSWVGGGVFAYYLAVLITKVLNRLVGPDEH